MSIACLVTILSGLSFLIGYIITVILKNTGCAALSSVISGVLAIGMLPFLESSFNITTNMSLLELANPNSPLLKRLLMEAPGTYHHSIMVANLAEVAAEEINANSVIVRVGAYYHDVGKIVRPLFFPLYIVMSQEQKFKCIILLGRFPLSEIHSIKIILLRRIL